MSSSDISSPDKKAQDESPLRYQGIFDIDRAKNVPHWLPLSLLALTTAALAVPIVLLRRQRATELGRTLVDAAAPPPRRTVLREAPLPRRAGDAPPPRRSSTIPPPPPLVSKQASPSLPPSSALQTGAQMLSAGDNFNAALYCAKAFGIATLLVGACAGTAIWWVNSALDVHDSQEFGRVMRTFIVSRMPFLSSRIHRLQDPENNAPDLPSPPLPSEMETDALQWTWPDAEKRLKAAYERDGFMGWAEAALREVEIEEHAERIRKGHA